MKYCSKDYENYALDEETKSQLIEESNLQEKSDLIVKTYKDYEIWKSRTGILMIVAILFFLLSIINYFTSRKGDLIYPPIIGGIVFIGSALMCYYFGKITYSEYLKYKKEE